MRESRYSEDQIIGSCEAKAIYDFCIELHEEGRLNNETFRALDQLDHRSVMDLVACAATTR